MDISRLLNLPATLTTRTVTGELDESGDAVTATVETEIRCWVTPTRSEENDGLATNRFTGYFLPDTVIDKDATLTLGTATYEFDGQPGVHTHPIDGEDKFQEASLVRTI